jgi:lysozyme
VADARGIDVSNAQGPSFDWAAERGRISFAFIKATEGITYIDPDFARNWQQAREIGVVRGAYHFGHPADAPDSAAGAFLAEVRRQGLEAGDMLALDLEVTDGRTPAEVSAFARAWCAYVAGAAGRKPVVYTNQSFAEAGNCAGLGGYPLWIAEWSAPAGQPSVPAPWTGWAFHQYTDSPVDQDVFHGDEAALRAFAGLQQPSPKEEEVQSGQLNNGANAITIVSVPWNSATNIAFGCDNGRQGLPPAKLRVAIYDTYWHIFEETVDSTKGQAVVWFPDPARTGVISIERQDAGNVVVGYEVS